jgi:chaperonin cofactor prefoldin
MQIPQNQNLQVDEQNLLLQLQLIRAELEQIERVKEFLKNLEPGRKIYINLGEVMVESNYLEAIQYLEDKEKALRSLLLEIEGKISVQNLQKPSS